MLPRKEVENWALEESRKNRETLSKEKENRVVVTSYFKVPLQKRTHYEPQYV